MPRYVLSPEARQDLAEIRAHYLNKADARVARHVLGEIARAFRFLAATPGAGHSRADLAGEPVNFWQVFSYLIVYDPAMRPIGIVRVRYSSQDLDVRFPPDAVIGYGRWYEAPAIAI